MAMVAFDNPLRHAITRITCGELGRRFLRRRIAGAFGFPKGRGVLLMYSRVKGEGRKNLEIAFKQRALHGKVGKVGWIKGNTYPNGVPVAYVAAIQEFTPFSGGPPRSFMRTAIAENQISWKKIAYYGAQKVVAGKASAGYVMEQIGLKAAGDIRKKITTIMHPPLAASTIARRKARYANSSITGLLTKPLVDTKRMLNTLTNSVEDR